MIEISESLERCSFGIVCLTPENQKSDWINFESGAIAKLYRQRESRLFTYLHELENSQVTGPLSLFQHVAVGEAGTLKIVVAINDAMPKEDRIDGAVLKARFDKFYPDLKAEFDKIPEPDQVVPEKRKPEDMIPEMFDLLRNMASQQAERAERPLRTFRAVPTNWAGTEVRFIPGDLDVQMPTTRSAEWGREVYFALTIDTKNPDADCGPSEVVILPPDTPRKKRTE